MPGDDITRAVVSAARDAAAMTQAAIIDGVDLAALARVVPTPFYAYSTASIRGRIEALKNALSGLDALICFAVKANSNLAILQLIARAGLGADIVSGGELQRCLRAGIAAERLVFSGVGKTAEEIGSALDAGILRFNLESRDELECLQRVAQARGKVARAAVRVNPDVDAHTHAKITTGRAQDKFGVSLDEARIWFAASAGYPNVCLDGLHVHIGSQLCSIEPYRAAFARIAAFWRELVTVGNAIASIDVGGGLGVCYRADQDRPLDVGTYISAIRDAFTDFRGQLVLEPRRWLVAEAGVLLTRVARARTLPRCREGDLLMIRNVGAYGAAMASTYNSRPLLAEVLLERGRYAIVRRRQTIEDLMAGESAADSWYIP